MNSPVFRIFTAFRFVPAYVVHIRIFHVFQTCCMCSAYVVHILCISGPRTLFLHLFTLSSMSHCVLHMLRICCAYVAQILCISGPRTFFCIVSTHFPHISRIFHSTAFLVFVLKHVLRVFSRICFTILSSEKSIVFRILCTFHMC
jgi:hypothetical protein